MPMTKTEIIEVKPGDRLTVVEHWRQGDEITFRDLPIELEHSAGWEGGWVANWQGNIIVIDLLALHQTVERGWKS